MPRSRSRSLLSMTRSSTCWLSRKDRIAQQDVDERRLAVVDVGDDGDIAQFHERPIQKRHRGPLGPAVELRALYRGIASIVQCS